MKKENKRFIDPDFPPEARSIIGNGTNPRSKQWKSF